MHENAIHEKEGIDSLDIFAENYTYIGQDADGYHHHADKGRGRIIVTDKDAEPVEDGWYYQLNDVKVNHLEFEIKYAPELERWADFVADRRGWEDRALYTCPELTLPKGNTAKGERA